MRTLHGKPKHLGSRDSSDLLFLHFSNVYLYDLFTIVIVTIDDHDFTPD